MDNHTPGPWAILEKHVTVLGEAVYGIYAPTLKGRWGIFLGSVATQPPDVTKANAALIVAAPELYEALKKANTCMGIPSYVRELIQKALGKAMGATTDSFL